MRAAVLLAVSIATGVSAAGVARRPPLGFNTWNQFACNGINAGAHQPAALTPAHRWPCSSAFSPLTCSLVWAPGAAVIKQTADLMVSTGLAGAGFEYIVGVGFLRGIWT